MASSSINMYIPLARPQRTIVGRSPSIVYLQHEAGRFGIRRGLVVCCAVQESSSTATVTDKSEPESAKATAPTKESSAANVTDKKEPESAKATAPTKESSTANVTEKKAAVPAKPKKAPVKALPEMMVEDVIPSLKAILEGQEDLSQIELSFQDNRLEGSFLKNDVPHYFWAFFPDGVLTGPKGFSLSSHGSGASTVEPFLIDERKITDKLVVFWVKKRLAAQGILPVWKE